MYRDGVGYNQIVLFQEDIFPDCGLYWADCFLVVQSKARIEKGELPVAFWFDGFLTDDEYRNPYEELERFIEENGCFCFNGKSTTASSVRAYYKGKQVSLTDVLWSIYKKRPIEEAAEETLRLANGRRQCIYGDEELMDFVGHSIVYDMRACEIRDGDTWTAHFTNGKIFPSGWIGCANTCVKVSDKKRTVYSFTDSNEELRHELGKIGGWYLEGNRAKTSVGDVPLASICGAFFNFWDRVKCPGNIYKTLKRIRQAIGNFGIVFDHLTDTPEINFPWLLAPISFGQNAALSDRRSRIRAPYYFFTVYDYTTRKLLVWCGVEGYQWERRFAFNCDFEHPDTRQTQDYVACFFEFKKRVANGKSDKDAPYILNKPGDECLLHYWGSCQERVLDPRSPLRAPQKMQLDGFNKYEPGCFGTMPILAPEAEREQSSGSAGET